MPVLPKSLTRSMSRSLPLLLAGALIVPITAAPAAAQETPSDLEARAEALHDHPVSWKRAAGLYREAARLRSTDDPRAVRDLRLAAKISYYAGSRIQAVRDLERASDASLGRGDLHASAMDLLDAAIVALESGRDGKALELAARSRALAESPGLDPRERSRILGRVGETEAIAMR